MKIFGWMQSKLNGKPKTSKTISQEVTHHPKRDSCKEEFSDWPNGLLAIGTFGNDNVKVPEKYNNNNVRESTRLSPFQDHLEEITTEEAKQLHKELKLLLNNESESNSSCPPLEKFFDCLQTLEDINKNGGEIISDNSSSLNNDANRKGNISISKKSLSFLLRKTFFGAVKPKITPIFRDPVEIKLEKSRMEKILRSILHKKIYPQSHDAKVATKKFLWRENSERKYLDKNYDPEMDKSSDGNKWDKSDSDFIVLEI